MALSKAQMHRRRFERLKSERLPWENTWRDTLDLVLPRKADIGRYTQAGTERGWELLDSTGENANETLAGFLHSGLTNPASIFFELTTGDTALDDDDDNRAYLADVGKLMHHVLANSNFHTEMHEIYLDLCSIGTACLWMEKDPVSVVRFRAEFMGDVFIDEGVDGRIDTVYILKKWKYEDAAAEWPENSELERMAKENPNGMTDIVHCICPRTDRIYGKKNRENKPFMSAMLWLEKTVILSEGGFDSFPGAVPRWTKASGESYGRSPGMKVRPDAALLQAMKRTVMMQAEKEADPPTIIPDEGYLLPIDTLPGAHIYKRPGAEQLQQLRSGGNFPITRDMILDTQGNVKTGYFLDRLNLMQGPQKTATEVVQITEENMRILGPMVSRQHEELLRPIVDRLWDIMVQQKMMPRAPTALQGKKIDVRYSSVAAKAQRTQEAANLQAAIQTVVPLAGAFPTILDNFEPDEIARYIANLRGIPNRVITKRRKMKITREQREAARAQAMQMQQAQMSAENAKNVAPLVRATAGVESGEEEAG